MNGLPYYLSEADRARALYLRRHSGLIEDPEFHEAIEFIFVISGSVRCHADENSKVISSGEFFCANPYQKHFYEKVSKKLDAIVCVISYEYSSVLTKNYPNTLLPNFMCNKEKNEEAFRIVTDWFDAPNKNFLLNSGYACMLFNAIIERYPLIPKGEKTESSLAPTLMSYLQDHYLEDISLKDLSKTLGYSKEYLSAALFKATGQHFREYLDYIRFKHANEMLLDSNNDMTIEEAIFASGFKSPATFYRTRKRLEKNDESK